MYIWQVSQQTNHPTFGSVEQRRFVVTSSKRAEDALFRLRQAYNTESEILNSIKFVGYLPGIAETSQLSRQKIYYVRATYRQPSNPSTSIQLKRVVTEFYDQIDSNMASILGIEDPIGPIPTGPNDAIDVAKIGIVFSLTNDDPTDAREIMQSHVFRGSVEADQIYIEEMRRINAEII